MVFAGRPLRSDRHGTVAVREGQLDVEPLRRAGDAPTFSSFALTGLGLTSEATGAAFLEVAATSHVIQTKPRSQPRTIAADCTGENPSVAATQPCTI